MSPASINCLLQILCSWKTVMISYGWCRRFHYLHHKLVFKWPYRNFANIWKEKWFFFSNKWSYDTEYQHKMQNSSQNCQKSKIFEIEGNERRIEFYDASERLNRIFFPSYSLINSLNSVFSPGRDSWAEGAHQGSSNISSYVASWAAEIRGHCYACCRGRSRTLLTQWT